MSDFDDYMKKLDSDGIDKVKENRAMGRYNPRNDKIAKHWLEQQSQYSNAKKERNKSRLMFASIFVKLLALLRSLNIW